jgi:hypothetical protein
MGDYASTEAEARYYVFSYCVSCAVFYRCFRLQSLLFALPNRDRSHTHSCDVEPLAAGLTRFGLQLRGRTIGDVTVTRKIES